MSTQPTLFEAAATAVDHEKLTLYALGEFQSRGKILAMRELALDRLRGAFRRASEKYGTGELTDEQIAENLKRLGATVVEIPNFVAKHPFRVTVSKNLSEKAKEFYASIPENDPR
jgi:signal transduction histidine kinase